MRISLAQMHIEWENKSANFEKVLQLTEDLNNNVTDMLILPELFSTGYTMKSRQLAESSSGETLTFLSSLASEKKIYAVGGYIEQANPKPRNSAVILDPCGSLVLSYSKIHLLELSKEHLNYSPGNSIATMDINGDKLAVIICYDLRFPDIFLELHDKNVKAVIVIANWPEKRISHWDAMLKSRAIENQIYVAGINRTGQSPYELYSGHSAVFGPSGEICSSLTGPEESIITVEIDFHKVDCVRNEFPVLNNRRNLF